MELADSGAYFPEQTPQRQIEIAGRQPVQIQLWQQFPDLLALPLEPRHDAALEPFAEATHPGTPHGNGAVAERELARFAVAVAVAGFRIHPGPSLRFQPTQQLGDFFLQDALHPFLTFAANVDLQRLKANT